jgi:hypothetical protein
VAVLQTKNAYLEAFKQQVVAGLRARGVAELGPQHQVLLAQIEDQQAANTLRWQASRAANTEHIYRKQHYAPGPDGRPVPISAGEARLRQKFGTKIFDAGLNESVDDRKAQRDLGYDVAGHTAKKRAEAQIARETTGDGGYGQLSDDEVRTVRSVATSREYKSRVAMKSKVKQLLSIARKHGGKAPDVYGPVDLPDFLRGQDKQDWDRLTDDAVQLRINSWTGAVASPEQTEAANIALGESGTWTAGQRVKALELLDRSLDDEIVEMEAPLTERARQFLRRSPDLPGASPRDVADVDTRESIPFIDDDEE